MKRRVLLDLTPLEAVAILAAKDLWEMEHDGELTDTTTALRRVAKKISVAKREDVK